MAGCHECGNAEHKLSFAGYAVRRTEDQARAVAVGPDTRRLDCRPALPKQAFRARAFVENDFLAERD